MSSIPTQRQSAYSTLITPSPVRSTPSLDTQAYELWHTPIDDPLATPEISDDFFPTECPDMRSFLEQKLRRDDQKAAAAAAALSFGLPSLHQMTQNQVPLPSERLALSSDYKATSSYPSMSAINNTVRPQDIFPDYVNVMAFLAEQERPLSPSPSECSSSLPPTPTQFDIALPDVDECPPPPAPESPLTPTSEYESPREVGVKAKRTMDEDDDMPSTKRRAVVPKFASPPTPRRQAKRKAVDDDDDEDFAPSPKRRVTFADDREDEFVEEDDMEIEEDVSEDFHPSDSRRGVLTRKTPQRRGRRSAANKTRKPALKPKDAPKKKTVVQATCDCGRCEQCKWTCRCPLKYGPREGQLCNAYFASHRDLDFKRHQEAHAVHEWFWCKVMGKLTPQQASWYTDKYQGQPMGLFCPNHAPGWDRHKTVGDGDCMATFTRRDALVRHLKNHTCYKEWAPELVDPANPTKLDAKKVAEASRKRWEFIAPMVKETIAAQAAGKTLTSQQAAIMKSLIKFEHEKDVIVDGAAESDAEDD